MIQQRPPLPGAAFVVRDRGSASSSRRSISGPFILRSYPKQTMQPKPGHAAQAHGQDGVPFELPQRKKSRGKAADADPVQMGEGLCIAAKRHHRQDGKPCAKDKCHDDRPQAGQNALQQGNVLVPAVLTEELKVYLIDAQSLFGEVLALHFSIKSAKASVIRTSWGLVGCILIFSIVEIHSFQQ